MTETTHDSDELDRNDARNALAYTDEYLRGNGGAELIRYSNIHNRATALVATIDQHGEHVDGLDPEIDRADQSARTLARKVEHAAIAHHPEAIREVLDG